jgi:hypothetical protein
MNCTLYSTLPIVLYGLYEGIFISDNGRPKAFFDEPSTFGLYLVSVANGMYAENFLGKKLFNKTVNIVFFAALMCVASLTKTANFLSFILVSLVILFFVMKKNVANSRHYLIYFCFFVLFLGILYSISDQIVDKFSNENNANISLMSWLRGFDQAMESIKISPLFGFGGGSTGQFDFYSSYTELLSISNLQILNLNDAYSLSFRLIIEFGILFFVIFLVCIANKIVKLFLNINKYENISSGVIFNIFFALTLIIGCLIKEPTYSRSLIYVGIFLFFGSFKWYEK